MTSTLPAALLVTALGVAALVVGLWLGGFRAETVSGLFIEIGAAIALVAVLMFVERRILRQATAAAKQTAHAVVRDETRSLTDRVLRLEELDEAQAARRAEHRRQTEDDVDAVRTGELNVHTVGKLLRDAVFDGLLASDHGFRVRTGPELRSPDLYPMVFAAGKDNYLYLSFEVIMLSGKEINNIPVPDSSPTILLWMDQGADEVASELESNLEQINHPTDGFSFGYALERIARSVEVMRRARAAPNGDPLRLLGKLIVLVNDQWALTDWGLESVDHDRGFAIKWVNLMGHGRPQRMPNGFEVLPSELPDVATPGWMDAQEWLLDRMGWSVITRSTKPKPPRTL